MSAARTIQVCFVCLGNICRSPTAEGVMVSLVEGAGHAARIAVDSAGTAAYHVGERADIRSRQEASRRGIELGSIARQFSREDFDRFDYVIAMDRNNRADLEALAGSVAHRRKLHLLRAFDALAAGRGELDVPDPYYGGNDGFAAVFEICEAGCRGLLAHIVREHAL